MEKIKSQRQRGGERLWVKKKRRVHQGKAIKCVGCSPPLSLASVTPAVLLSRCCCRCSRCFCFITLLLTSGCGTRKRLACLPSDWCISAKVLTVQRTAVSANWKKGRSVVARRDVAWRSTQTEASVGPLANGFFMQSVVRWHCPLANPFSPR